MMTRASVMVMAIRVAEGDGLVTNRRVFPHDHHIAVEIVALLDPDRDLHADRAADTSLDAQHVVTVRIHPDASLRRDRSRPVEAVLVPLLVFDELGIALPFDRYEIDADGWPVGFLPESRQLELVLGTMSREKKIERLGRERIRVGAAIAILPVFLARDATVDFSH